MRAREFIAELYNVPIIDPDLGSELDVVKQMRDYKQNNVRDAFFPDQRTKGVQDLIGGGAPRVRNIVAKSDLKYGEPPATLAGRNPASEKDITYAQRRVSQQELDDIRSTGYAVPPVTGTKFSRSDQPEKWWSPADSQGQFGRNWAKGDATIRIPTNQLPKNRAARSDDMQVQDPKTGEWHSMALKDTPQARYASQWERTRQNIPGMNPNTSKSEPTNARDAAIQHFMKEKGRLPVQGGYPGDRSGIGQRELKQLDSLIKGYEFYYPPGPVGRKAVKK